LTYNFKPAHNYFKNVSEIQLIIKLSKRLNLLLLLVILSLCIILIVIVSIIVIVILILILTLSHTVTVSHFNFKFVLLLLLIINFYVKFNWQANTWLAVAVTTTSGNTN